MRKVYDILSKYQGFFLATSLLLSFGAVSIRIDRESVQLILRDRPLLALLLLACGLFGLWIYMSIDKYKIKQLAKEIVKDSREDEGFGEKLEELTERQEEIYHLIIDGKSNKEICAALFIEPSTLKTHINQLYKKLEVQNRKQLKNRSKS